jgi:hypothetical protein
MRTRSHRGLAVEICLAALVIVALAGCGGGDDASAPAATTDVGQPGGSITPSAGNEAPSPTQAGRPGQTDTDWGRIWDTLPPGFPRYPGSTPADDATADPVSAADAVAAGAADEIASWFQTQLELATYSTEGLSGPLEDGSYVLDSVGDAGCRIQTTVAPMGGLILVTIRYGADCPA